MSKGNEWHRRKMKKLRAERGNRCEHCGLKLQIRKRQPNLQFAHLEPTELKGRGRGQNHRICDIARNPRKYMLLCELCHLKLDRILADDTTTSVQEPNEEPILVEAWPEPAPMLLEYL